MQYSRIKIHQLAAFVSQNSENFMILQIKYQGNHVLSSELYNDLNKLHFWHVDNIEKHAKDLIRKNLFETSHLKLKKYLFKGEMPAMKLFKASRFTDPRQFKNLDQNINTYLMVIPELKNCTTEWFLYADLKYKSIISIRNINKKQENKEDQNCVIVELSDADERDE
ncbi:hypothetical protein BpHYR1_040820 [Brachionus plicatilis]|uniref:Uncharacterized protein n=1 Tax=Brachionus plicatilis TaxID=10195 RepID=A0A3M7RDW7_BRAPC|nr:hypothetical protein BpHYR1_040820 [Brachionus plicatilis]